MQCVNLMTESAVSTLPMVSVVIPAKNEEANIQRTLDALCDQDYPQHCYEIIVVDNLSEDRTADIALQNPRVTLLESSGTIASVRNTGIEAAIGSVLAFIDADCIAPRHWLKRSVEHLMDDSAIGIVSSVLMLENQEGAPWVERYWIANHRYRFSREIVNVRTISSYCFCLRKEVLQEAGKFNPKLVTCEDSELGYRVTALGWKIVADKSIDVIHLENAKTLSQFFIRQLWQGRSNFENIRGRKFDFAELGSLAAPVVFSLSIVGSIVFAFAGYPLLMLAMLISILSVPAFIAYRKSPIKSMKDFFCFLIIWSTYLIARSMAILISIERKRR